MVEVDGKLNTSVKQVGLNIAEIPIEDVLNLRDQIAFVAPALDRLNEVIRGAIDPNARYLVYIPIELMS